MDANNRCENEPSNSSSIQTKQMCLFHISGCRPQQLSLVLHLIMRNFQGNCQGEIAV